MAYIRHVATALPPFTYTREELLSAGRAWLHGRNDRAALFERFLGSSRVAQRSFALPVDELLNLRDVKTREAVFREQGKELFAAVVRAALDAAGLAAEEVGTLVFTSCSVPTIPAIDAAILHQLGFSPAVRRIPLYQHGCAGGMVALALGSRLAEAGAPSVIVSLELCSLVFQYEDLGTGNLVGSALFGDGAACAVIDAVHGCLEVIASESYLIPNTEHLMGYDLAGDGAHLRLSRELPAQLSSEAPQRIRAFLRSRNVEEGDVAAWLFHPGGAKILESLQRAFDIPEAAMRWAWDVLSDVGNLSSATVLFVLSEYLKTSARDSCRGQYALLFGVGPGLTLEMSLLRWAE